MADDSANPPSRIFISYRRDDSEWAVVALNDKLRDHFGDRVFKDTDNIAPGQDFERVINQELQSCSVMLAVIGKDWLTARDPKSQARRLDDPRDTLRLEIATALRNEHVLVIPVLVKGAAMPATADLPADLEPLSRRNAAQLSGGASWNADVERLIRAIERATGIGAAPAPPVARPAVDPPPVAAPEPTAEDFEARRQGPAARAGSLRAKLPGRIRNCLCQGRNRALCRPARRPGCPQGVEVVSTGLRAGHGSRGRGLRLGGRIPRARRGHQTRPGQGGGTLRSQLHAREL